MLEFAKCRFDDAEISQVLAADGNLIVIYRDWQEKEQHLVFVNVAGYQSFSPEGKALSHATVETEDALLSLACEMAEEASPDGFKVYSFVSAWNDAKILRIVAKDVQLKV